MNGTVIQKIHGLYDKYRHENDHQHVGLLSTAITTVKTRVCSRPIIYKLGAMPGTGILYDDWKDYDNRKTRQKLDPSTFCCEDWEVGYLASKIRKHHPFPEPAIREAIRKCCIESSGKSSREEFVNQVIKKLADN